MEAMREQDACRKIIRRLFMSMTKLNDMVVRYNEGLNEVTEKLREKEKLMNVMERRALTAEQARGYRKSQRKSGTNSIGGCN